MPPSRRAVLGTLGIGAAALAGCSLNATEGTDGSPSGTHAGGGPDRGTKRPDPQGEVSDPGSDLSVAARMTSNPGNGNRPTVEFAVTNEMGEAVRLGPIRSGVPLEWLGPFEMGNHKLLTFPVEPVHIVSSPPGVGDPPCWRALGNPGVTIENIGPWTTLRAGEAYTIEQHLYYEGAPEACLPAGEYRLPTAVRVPAAPDAPGEGEALTVPIDATVTVTEDTVFTAAATVGSVTPRLLASSGADSSDGVKGPRVDGAAPMYRYGLARSGVAPGASGPVTGVTERWRLGLSGVTRTSPVVVDGTLYLVDDNLRALDAADGSEQWATETLLDTSPVVVDDTVYAGHDGVAAYDTADGTKRWQTETDTVGIPGATVAGGTVYVGTAEGSTEWGKHHVLALDASDGAEQWRTEVGGRVNTSPAVADGTVFVGSTDGAIYALGVTDGVERWRVRTSGTVWSSPAVVGDTVYFGGGDGSVRAHARSDGRERWRFRTGYRVRGAPAVVDGTVYVASSDRSVYAVDAADGQQAWRFETGREVVTPPAATDEAVYVRSRDGYVYALDAGTGEQLWRFWTGGEDGSPPVVADSTVYVVSEGTLYALTEP